MSTVADRYAEIQELGIEVLGISTDSPYVHKVWDEEEISHMVDGGVPYVLGSDAGGRLGELFEVYDEEGGVDVRGSFIIDPDGVLQAFEVLSPAVGRNVDEVLRQIQGYQMNRKTNGAEAAPAGWTPGKQTLKPSDELIGNVWKTWKVDEAR